MNIYIGIDISKDSLSVAYPKLVSGFEMKTFTNNELGIEQLISSLPPDAWCVVEATGVYSRLLSYRLHESGQFVSVINPKQSAAFAKIQQSIVKNDNKDAQLLSLYGKHMNPPQWIPQSENVLKIRQKRTLIDQFTKQKVALNNVLLGIFRDVVQDKSSVKSLNDSIVFLQEQIKILEEEICQISEEDFKKYYDLIQTVKGIGPKIASSIVSLTGGFTLFENAKQFIKFIGTAPNEFQSGSSVKAKTRINRSGQASLRAKLYVAAQSALRGNKACKTFFDRLKANGKNGKAALIGVINKLIRQVFAVAFSGKEFDNDFQENLEKITTFSCF